MLKTKSLIILVLLVILSSMTNINAQLNETFNGITSGIPNGWDNSDYDNVNLTAWLWDASGYDGAAMACKAIDVSTLAYSVLKTPTIMLPVDCQLSFVHKATSSKVGKLSVFMVVENSTITLFNNLNSSSWELEEYDLSAYSGKYAQLYFKLECGGTSTNESSWFFLDNVKVANKPACARPKNLVLSALSSKTAQIMWSLDNVGAYSEKYHLEIKNLKDNSVTKQDIIAPDMFYDITGLKANVDYEVSLTTDCSSTAQGQSEVAKIYFTTLCSSQRLAYKLDFNGFSFPDCSFMSETGASVQGAIKTGTNSDGSALKLSTSTDKSAYFITRQLNKEANKMQISMDIYGKVGTKYSLYLTPDPINLAEAIVLWKDEEVLFDNKWYRVTYNTSIFDFADKNLSFVISVDGGSNSTLYVDNLYFENAPKCPSVNKLREVITDSTFTQIDWEDYVQAQKYEVFVQEKVSSSKEEAFTKTYFVTGHPCVIDSLEKNKYYSISVRAWCSEADSSAWSNTVDIHTTCGVRAETIFFEDFESGIFPPDCWFTLQTKKYSSMHYDPGDQTWRIGNEELWSKYIGNYSATWQTSTVGNRAIFVAQPIEVDLPYHYDLSLWIYRNAVSDKTPKNEGLNIWVNNRPDTINATKLGFVSSVISNFPIEQTEGFHKYEYNIPISGNVYIILEGVSEGGYNMYVDDIEVKLAPLCRKVSEIAISEISNHDFKVTWRKGLNESKWNVSYTLITGQNEISNSVVVEGAPELKIENLIAGSQYSLKINIAADCGSGDVTEAVSFAQTFETDCDVINAFPYIQTFDGNKFPPHCWSQHQSQAYGNPNDLFVTDWGDEAWVRNDDKIWNPEFIKAGAASAKLQTSSSGIRSALVSPKFNFEAGKEYVVSFWMYRISKANESTPTVDNEGLNIWANSNPNVKGATKLGYVNIGSQFAPKVEVDGFYQYEFNISTSGEQYIIFEGQHQGTMDIFIDNVVIREKTSCSYINVVVDSIKTTIARVTVLEDNVGEWQISVGLPGFNPNTGTISNVNGKNYIVQDLQANTDYELYVRRKCDDGTYGPWSEFVYKFATQCAPIVVDFDNPFFDGFEGYIADELLYGCYQQIYGFEEKQFFTANSTRNDNGEETLKPYEGVMLAAVPYNSTDTWLFRPFQLKANSNYEVSFWARQDCDFGMNASIAYCTEPNISTLIDTMVTAELNSEWHEYKGWINAPEDGVYYIGINIDTWGISYQQYYSVIDNFSVKEIECAPPVQVKIAKITSQSAEVDFHSIADVWEIKVASVNFDPEYGVADIVDDTIRNQHYEIKGLQTNKDYYFSLRSLCAETSEWSHVKSFRTICSTFELPYYEDFEDPELNNILCWNSYLNNEYTSKSEVSAVETYEGKVAFKMYESMTILPKFNVSSLSNYLVRGYALATDANAHISVGVVGDINNPIETFEPVADVIIRKDYEWQEFVAYLSDLSKPDFAEFANAQYIAMVVSNGTEFYVDNLEVIEIPTCLSPTEIVLSELTENSCKIGWYENGNATKWQVRGYYKNELLVDTIVTTNPAVISGLNPASEYRLEISAICSDVDQSWWSQAGIITTLCDVYSLPYDNTFDGLAQPKCWSQGLAYPNVSANYWIHKDGTYRYNQHYDEETEKNISGSTSMLVSPKFNLVGVDKATLTFDYTFFNAGTLKVLLSEDGGVNFDNELAFVRAVINGKFSMQCDLTPYIGKVVVVGIEASSSGKANSYLFIDNFSVEQITACVRPISLSVDFVYDTSARLLIEDTTTYNTRWQYAVGSVGFDPNKVQAVDITNKTFTIENLTPRTNYEVYVRTKCGSNEHSYWRGPIEIQTTCPLNVEFPYYEGFEGITSLENNCFSIFRFNSTEATWPSASLNTKTYVSAGVQGLQLSSSETHCLYFALPLFATPLRDLKISFDYRNEYDAGYPTIATQLELGVMDNLNIEESYSRLVLLPYTSTLEDNFDSYVYSFAEADAKIDLTDKFIVFKYNTSPETKNGVWAGIDNIMIVPHDYCYPVENLSVVGFTESSISLSWSSPNSVLQEYEYQLLNNNAVIREGSIVANNVELTALEPAMNYQFQVRCKCSDDKYSDWAKLNVRTLALAPEMPYSVNFEDEEHLNWILCNEGQTNYFVVGSDRLGVKSGSKALYITNDGELNQYNIGATSSAYAYRILSFEPGQYRFSYSWKCNGEYTDAYTADYGRVYLSPVTKDIVAGRRTSSFMGDTKDCVMLDGAKGLNVSSRWNDVVVDVVFTEAVKYNLVVEWYNNAMGGSQTPFAIDDISIEKIACPMPQSIEMLYVEDCKAHVKVNTVVDADSYSYRLSLTNNVEEFISSGVSVDKSFAIENLSPATDYYLFVSAQCGVDETSGYQSIKFKTENAAATIPYSNDFASSDENSKWVIVNGTQKNGFVLGNSSLEALYISYQTNATNPVYGYDSEIGSAVYAYRLVNLEKGQYMASFDWKSVGSSADYGRLFIVPTSYPIEAGKQIGSVNSVTKAVYLPEECIPVDGGILNNSISEHADNTFFIEQSGTYKLVAQWYNKGTYTSTQPLWIDNIVIDKTNCAEIKNVEIVSLNHNSVSVSFANYNETPTICAISTSNNVDLAFETITLNSDSICLFENLTPETKYFVFLRAQCADNLYSEWTSLSFTTECAPIEIISSKSYYESFEDYRDNAYLDNCWTYYYKKLNGQSMDNDKSLYVTSDMNLSYNHYSQEGEKYLTLSGGNKEVFASRQFYLRAGRFYSISAWVVISPIDNSNTTFKLVNFNTQTTLAEHVVGYEGYTEVKAVFVPSETGIYDLGFDLRVGSSVSYTSIDNFRVEELQFGAPSQLTITDLSTTTAKATWYGVADYYKIELYSGSELVLDTITHDMSYVLSNLSPATSYSLGVCAVVESNNTQSNWSTIAFTTECDVAQITHNQDFEQIQLGYIPMCWDNESLSLLADYTKNLLVRSESSNKSLTLNTTEIYGTAVALSPMIHVEGNNILSYRYRNLSHTDVLKVEIRGAGTRVFSDVILEGGHSGWQQKTFDLAAYKGDTIQVAFTVEAKANKDGALISVDDFRVANYAGEVTEYASICQGGDYAGHGFYISSSQLFVGVNQFSQFITSNQSDTIKHLELTVYPVASSHTYDTICRGDIYMWGDIPCVETNNYEVWYRGMSSKGCDSVAYLHLEVLDLRENISARICEGETYRFGGVDYFETGIYVDTIPNPGSCDSIKILTLVVVPTTTETSYTICEGELFTWNDTILTTSGRYVHRYKNDEGCECFDYINFTVLPKFVELNATICQGTSYLLGARELTEAGVYSDSLINVLGCDSIVKLTLSVSEPTRGIFDDYVCEGYEYVGFGFRLNASDIKGDTTLSRVVKNIDGCDSIIQVNVAYIPMAVIDTTVFISEGDYYDFGEQTLTKPGKYTETFITAEGCDSVINLTLEYKTALDNIHSLPLIIAPNPIHLGQMPIIDHTFTFDEQQGLKVEVINSVGQVIFVDTPTTYPIMLSRIDVCGIYYIRIITGKGESYVGKLIVQ